MNLNDKLLIVLNEYKQLGIADQIDYDKFYLYSLITHSTAIEGSTVTEIENQLLFDEGISAKGRTMQEQLMNLDLKNAYEQAIRMAKSHTDFSLEMLKDLSALVMKNTGSSYNTIQGSFNAAQGDLRLVNVMAGAGGKSYLNYTKVPSKLAAFCQEMNERRLAMVDSKDLLEQYLLSFDAHLQLVTIHPWADGNGRMSRLIMNYIQFEFGLLPTKVKKEDKAEYIQALIDSREQDSPQPFREFMLQEHLANLREEIETFNHSEGGQKIEKVDRKGGQKTREAILDLIKNNEKITSTKMAQTLGINRSAISKHLKKMQDEGMIRREGPDKGGKWVVVK